MLTRLQDILDGKRIRGKFSEALRAQLLENDKMFLVNASTAEYTLLQSASLLGKCENHYLANPMLQLELLDEIIAKETD